MGPGLSLPLGFITCLPLPLFPSPNLAAVMCGTGFGGGQTSLGSAVLHEPVVGGDCCPWCGLDLHRQNYPHQKQK